MEKNLLKDQIQGLNLVLNPSFLHRRGSLCPIISAVMPYKLEHVRFVPKKGRKMLASFQVMGVAGTACQFEKVNVTFVL